MNKKRNVLEAIACKMKLIACKIKYIMTIEFKS